MLDGARVVGVGHFGTLGRRFALSIFAPGTRMFG
jgi:hypothetical protein